MKSSKLLHAARAAHPSGVIHDIVPGQQHFRDRNDAVAVLQQEFDHRGKRLRRVLCGVVEQYDAAGLYAAFDALGDLRCGELLPIEAVHIPLDRFHPHFVQRLDHMVVILAVRAAEEGGADAGDGFDLIAACGDVAADGVGAEL